MRGVDKAYPGSSFPAALAPPNVTLIDVRATSLMRKPKGKAGSPAGGDDPVVKLTAKAKAEAKAESKRQGAKRAAGNRL